MTRNNPPPHSLNFPRLTRLNRHLLYQQDEETEETINFMNSPTNWICQSFQYLSPTKNTTHTSYTTTSTDTSSRYEDEESLENLLSVGQQRRVTFDQRPKILMPPATYSGNFHISSPSSSRIIAPNVAKLSAHSTVEIILNSNIEDAVILCSADVLKMRSQYFETILLEQEKLSSSPTTPSNTMWRSAIVIEEPSPYEGAAFLESIHEGKGLYCGEWNLCWARLRLVTIFQVALTETVEIGKFRIWSWNTCSRSKVTSKICLKLFERITGEPIQITLLGLEFRSFERAQDQFLAF